MVDNLSNSAICVVGAGILGVSAALHLVRSGARNVTLVDAAEPLGGTTPAGAGFVAAFAADSNRRLSRACVSLETYGVEFYTNLHESGRDLEFKANGNIVLALSEDSLDRLSTGLLKHPDRLPGTRLLSAEEVGQHTSGAVEVSAVAGGILLAEGIQITTSSAVTAILAELTDAGVTIRHGTHVTGIETLGETVTGVETTDGTISADAVVLACGAWTNELLEPRGWRLPMTRVVATRMVTRAVGVPPSMPTIQCPDLQLWIRELHGAWSWGVGSAYRRASLLEDANLGIGRPRSEDLIEAQLQDQEAVAAVFPTLAGEEPETIIQGMPTYTADGNLFVGPVPGSRGLFAIAGDNESGVTHGPGMGRLVAELVLDVTPFVDPYSFRLDRSSPQDYPDEESVVQALAGDRVAGAMQ